MSVETTITITCSRCGKKSTSDNYKKFCSKVNLPSVEHFNNFGINKKLKLIKLIQAKPDDYNPKHILKELNWLNGEFRVDFEVR